MIKLILAGLLIFLIGSVSAGIDVNFLTGGGGGGSGNFTNPFPDNERLFFGTDNDTSIYYTPASSQLRLETEVTPSFLWSQNPSFGIKSQSIGQVFGADVFVPLIVGNTISTAFFFAGFQTTNVLFLGSSSTAVSTLIGGTSTWDGFTASPQNEWMFGSTDGSTAQPFQWDVSYNDIIIRPRSNSFGKVSIDGNISLLHNATVQDTLTVDRNLIVSQNTTVYGITRLEGATHINDAFAGSRQRFYFASSQRGTSGYIRVWRDIAPTTISTRNHLMPRNGSIRTFWVTFTNPTETVDPPAIGEMQLRINNVEVASITYTGWWQHDYVTFERYNITFEQDDHIGCYFNIIQGGFGSAQMTCSFEVQYDED